MKVALKEENIASLVFFIRGEKVMLDSHIARLYNVESKRIKEAARRNIKRFPGDFMFELSQKVANALKLQMGVFNLRS